MIFYTIYKTTNLTNNYIYIGCHITTNPNDNYLGSGTNLKKDIKLFGKENFIKEILFIYDNKKDMIKKEKELVNDLFIARTDTYNIITGGAFITNNCVVVKDKDNNIFMTHVTNPLYLSGELVSCNVGLITVKDINGKVQTVYKNDPRYLSGELFSVNKNTVLVIDKTGKKRRVDKNDPRITSGEFQTFKMINEEIKKLKKFGLNNTVGGKICITNLITNKKKYIYPNELELYEKNNWIKGRLKNKTPE
jgi:hypothetical protein